MNKFLFRHILLLALVVGLLAGLIPQTAPTTVEAAPTVQTGVGRMRFVNATVSREAFRVVVNNQLVATTVRELVGYFTFNSGDYTIYIQTNAGQEVAQTQLTLENATRLTIAVVGPDLRNASIVVTQDDATPLIRNTTRVRVVNAVEGSSALPVLVDGQETFSAVAFGESSDYQEFPGGSYNFQLGDKTPNDLVVDPGRYYTIYFIGAANASNPSAYVLIGRPFRVSGENRFRFMNLVEVEEGQEEVLYDVYVNKEDIPTYAAVYFGEATYDVVVAPGEYVFDVYTLGANPDADTPVTSITLNIAEDQSLFIIATGTPGDVKLNIFSDDVTPVPVNTSRLQVINLSTFIPEFSVVSQNNITLVDEVPFGSMVTSNVPGGNYQVSLFSIEDSARVGRGEFLAASGSLATLIIYGSTRQSWTFFNEPIEQVATVRIVHASPTAPTVDIYLNGDLVLNNIGYGEYTDYLTLTPGNYVLTVYPDGINPESGELPLWRDELNITGNAVAFTMVALGTDNFRVNVYADNLEIIPIDQARIRFIHAAINVTDLTVVNAANDGVLANLQFGTGSDNLNVNANTRTFTFNLPGSGSIYRIESLPLVPAGYYTFIIIGDAAQPETLRHLQLEVLP